MRVVNPSQVKAIMMPTWRHEIHHNDTQLGDVQHNGMLSLMLTVTMKPIITIDFKCHYDKCRSDIDTCNFEITLLSIKMAKHAWHC